jgi:hypothetical protein
VVELPKRAAEGHWVAAITELTLEVCNIVQVGTWSRQLDKLLVTEAATGYTRQAANKTVIAELPGNQHRTTQAQEWLSAIRATLPDQDADTDTESKETCQETLQRTVITPPRDWLTREMSGLSLGSNKSAVNGAASMDMAKSQI